jgi:hypothetical protein
MKRSEKAAIVFAGDQPGHWWVVHTSRPRFAALLLSAEEFSADARFAALVPHGITPDVPVHFAQGADVLVITDFIDRVDLTESDSPQKAILSEAMIEALHRCQEAVTRLSRRDSAFAPLRERAEQFLVGWTAQARAADTLELRHVTGARVRVLTTDDGECDAELEALPPVNARFGWAEELLRDRLERVAGERGLLLRMGEQWLVSDERSELTDAEFMRVRKREPGRLRWGVSERPTPNGDRLAYAALLLANVEGSHSEVFPTEVELNGNSSLLNAGEPFSEADGEAIAQLLPGYGLASAVNLLAAHRFACFVEELDGTPCAHELPELSTFPCEIELATGGELYAAVVFARDERGQHRAVIAPHAPTPPVVDTAALLPFECVLLRREQFHLPRYLQTERGFRAT